MDYDFMKRERDFGLIVFALCLDRKKMTERIVIGEANETRRCLERGTGEVYYDGICPLGSLLFNFEADPDRLWNINVMRLRESYNKIFPFEAERRKMAMHSSDFLHEKYEKREPSAMFAAIRTWDEYLNCYRQRHGADLFLERTLLLYRPFFIYGQYKPWQEESTSVLSETLHNGESQVELWYPIKNRPFECVVAINSLQPLVFYYMNKIEEWGFVFQECKVCGKNFLARSRHYELCSDECRKVQAVQAKREFDQRTSNDPLEKIHESAYYYWYNRQRKIKRAKNTDAKKLAAVSEAFSIFRKEAVGRKKLVKSGEMKLSEFTSWINSQDIVIDQLVNE